MAEELLLHNHAAAEELLLCPYLLWTPTRSDGARPPETLALPRPPMATDLSSLQELQASPALPQEQEQEQEQERQGNGGHGEAAAGSICLNWVPPVAKDGSNSDRESNGPPKNSRKQKRGRAKLQPLSKKSHTRCPSLLQSQPASLMHGCLSLLKKKRSGGNRPRAVGKRTRRVPVASMYHRDDKIGPENRQAKPDANDG